jgi:DNA polymerase III delta prime subunit
MHNYLKKALAENQLPNTLLFVGATPSDIDELAHHLLRGTKSDLHHLQPEGKSGQHTIETIRAAIDASHSAPFEAPTKLFLLSSAERMQPAAANALLKTLEESTFYWILLTDKPSEILPTILSRCTKVTFSSSPLTTSSSLAEAKDLFLHAAREPYHRMIAKLEKIESLLDSEDPLLAQQQTEQLFLFIAQHFLQHDHWQEAFEEARLAHARNIKLSVCLESFLLNNITH